MDMGRDGMGAVSADDRRDWSDRAYGANGRNRADRAYGRSFDSSGPYGTNGNYRPCRLGHYVQGYGRHSNVFAGLP